VASDRKRDRHELSVRLLELAKRGWQVTGIDFVEKALARGRERVRQAGVEMRVVSDQRAAMGRGVEAVAGLDATLLLLVWPKRRRPLIRGASRDEVEAAFPAWTITDVEPSHFRLPKPLEWVLRPDEPCYRLRRRFTSSPSYPSRTRSLRRRVFDRDHGHRAPQRRPRARPPRYARGTSDSRNVR
jgi:hypothetical protein